MTKVSFYFMLVCYFLVSCSISRKMENKRKEVGIPPIFIYTSMDSLYMQGPIKWYLHDYKKNDSIDVTNKFVSIVVYITQTEVTNRQYNHFLNSLRNDSLLEEYNLYKPDHSGWLKIDSANPFYVKMAGEYAKETYWDYPVVNISKKAALAYIQWLNKVEPSKNVIYKIPNEQEWIKGFNNTDWSDSTYSWGSNSCQGSKQQLLGNFALLSPEQWRYDQLNNRFWFDDFKNQGYISEIEGPMYSYSFNPSLMGTYNMSGNVAELIAVPGDTIEEIGWTKGGSWFSVPHYGKKHTWERYHIPSPCVGFRVVKYEMTE